MAIVFDVGFRVTGKDELTKAIGPQLSTIADEINRAFQMPAGSGLKKEIIEATRQANILQNALKKATTDKGISFVSLNSELRKAGTTAEHMVTTLAKAGPAFSGSFNTALTTLATANRSVVGISEKIKEMQRVMTQSIKFTAAQTIQREVMSAVAQSIGWVKDLDRAITEISTVTGKTGDELEKVYETAVNGSRELRVAADEYAKGALIFYQQGLNDEEVQRRTEITIKAAKAAGASISDMSSQLTAIWNNYRMIGEEQERAASVGAALAAKTAVDFKDIATAMQSAAAPAAQMGVEYNQLAAIIATVGDVSQQSATTIGNAYKTIFSRFQQLKSEGTDGEVTLSSVSSQLKGLGINVIDQAGNLRDLGTVINEVGQNWDNWTQTQQTAIAQIVGGTRQYGQFLTLMQNFDKYQKNLAIADAEDGSELEGQYGRALDSIESKAENAGEAWKRAFSGVFDDDLIKKFYAGMETLGNTVDGIFGAFNDWKGILTIIVALLAKQLAPAMLNGARSMKDLVQNINPEKRKLNRFKESNETRKNAMDMMSDKNRRTVSDDTKKEIRDKMKDIESIQGENERDTANKQKVALKNLQQDLVANGMLSREMQRQLNLMMQKADIQERLGEMASQIEELEALGTEEAKQKADMLREQMEIYSQNTLALADATTEMQRQNERWGGVLDLEESGAKAALEEEAAALQEEVDNFMKEIEEKRAAAEAAGDYNFDFFEGADLDRQLKELQDKVEEKKKQIADVGGIERSIQNVGRLITDNLIDTLMNSENPGTELAQRIADGLNENRSSLEKAMKDTLNDMIENASEELNLEDIRNALQAQMEAALGDEEMTDEMRNRINSIMDLLSQGNNSDSQSQNIFGSLGEGVEEFQGGIDAAITGITNLAAAAAICKTGIEAMCNAMNEGDPIAFATGLGVAATGIMQMAAALPQAKAGIIGLKNGMVSLGSSISSIVPGLGGISEGVAAAGGAASATGATMAAAMAVAAVAVLAVVAAVAALVFIWNEYNNQKPENKLKRAQEAAQELTKAEEDAKDAAQELLDVFQNYKEAEEALEGCKRGTEEWEKALRKANEAALEVVDALPSDINVADAYTRGEDGRIRLNEDTIKAAQSNLDRQAQVASYTASSAKIQATMANNDLTASNIAKEIALAQYQYSAQSDTYDQGQAEDEIASLLIDSADKFNKLATEDTEGFRQALKEAGVDVENLSDTEIQNLSQRLFDLGNSTEAATEKMNLIAKLAVDELLDGKNYKDEVKDLTGERIAAQTKELTDMYLGALTNGKEGSKEDANRYGDIYQAQTKINGELLEEYNRLTGNNLASSGNGVQGTDTNRIFEFIDEEGNTIKKSAKQMAEEMAAAAALMDANVEGAAADIAKDFNILNGIINDAAQQGSYNSVNNGAMKAEAIKDILMNKNMDSLTDDELQTMAGMSNDQIKEMVKEMFNLDDTGLEEWVKGYGYDSAEAFANGVKEGAQASITASEHAADNLTKTTKKMFDEVADDGDLTVQAKENLARSLKQVFDNFDRETAQNFTDIVEKMGGSADSFLSNINDIDWETASPDNLREKLNELGVDASKLSDEDLQKLITSLRNVGDASVKSAQAFNKNLKDAAKGVTDNNSIIDDDDFQKLQQMGINVGEFFGDMADGTHQLLGDADEFKQLIHSIEMSKLQEVKENAEGTIKDLESAQWHIDQIGKNGGQLDEANMLNAMWKSGVVSNSERDDWIDRGGTSNVEVAEEVRKKYEEAGMSAEKIEEMLKEAANEAERAQAAMDNADFAFEVESAGLDLEETTRYAERLRKEMLKDKDVVSMTKDEMRLYTKAARDAAINNQRLDRGIGSLKDNIKDYKKALKETNKGTAEYSEAMDALKGDLADIVGFDDADLLSDDFALATLNSKDLEAAMKGDIEAIERLQLAAANDMMLNIQVNNELTDEEFQKVSTQWEYLKSQLEQGIEAGEVDQDKLLTSFNEMIKAGKMTKDQIEAALAGLHVSANVKTTYVKQKQQVPLTVTETAWLENGEINVPTFNPETGEQTGSYPKKSYKQITKTYDAGTDEADVVVPQYEIEGTTDAGGNTVAFTDAPPPKVSKGGSKFSDATGKSKGGGGSKSSEPKKAKKTSKTNQVDKQRYVDNKNAIEDITTQVDKLNTAQDHAWGSQRIRNINLINKKLAEQARGYQNLRAEAKKYIDQDSAALRTGLAAMNQKMGTNLEAKFDSDGFLLDNEMEIRNARADFLNKTYYEPIRALEDQMNAMVDKGVTEDDATYKSLKEKAEALKSDASLFESEWEEAVGNTLDKLQEAEKQYQDALKAEVEAVYTLLQNEVDKYTLKMELKLDVTDLERRLADAIRETYGELGNLGGQTMQGLHNNMLTYTKDFQTLSTHWGEMQDLLANWQNPEAAESLKKQFGITDEAYAEALKAGKYPQEIMDALEQDVDSLFDLRSNIENNLDEQWQSIIAVVTHYMEEFDKLGENLDSQMNRADSLLEIIDTVGLNYKWGADKGAASFRLMSQQLDAVQAKAKNVNAQLEYTTGIRQTEEEQLNKILNGRSIEDFYANASEAEAFEYNRIKEHYDEMVAKERELGDERLSLLAEAYSKAKEYAEQWAEVLVHESAEALGAIFDSYDEAMDVYNQKRDIDSFFMDEYDKVFELNKLQREINKTIEDISDPEALERYDNLLAEIEAKKAEGVKMTEKDLEILRAQFDLEVARDAYEDARNAKNTMRLARDASGNYSYIYSSDNNDVEDAAAKVEENLHNIHKLNREAADAYSETWLQLQVDWNNYIASVDQSRYEQDEQYRAMVDQRYQWYAQQSDQLAGEIQKHNDAIGRNFSDTTLGIITNFDDMGSANDTYKDNHDQLVIDLKANYDDWMLKADDTRKEVGADMDSLEDVVDTETTLMQEEIGNTTSEIENLKTQGLTHLNAFKDALPKWVTEVNRQFDSVIRKIQELIEWMIKLKQQQADDADAEINGWEYDPTKNVTGLAVNAANKKYAEYAAQYNGDEGQIRAALLADKEIQELQWQLEQKISDENMSGHTYVENMRKKAEENRQTLSQYAEEAILDIIDKAIKDLGKGHSDYETDYSDIAVSAKNKAHAATGGLFDTRTTTEIAEKGPELVLNAQDTENILKAVSLMRQTVAAQFGSINGSLAGVTSAVVGQAAPIHSSTQPQTVDQQVKIEASFPGVSVANEIEEALNSLITQAAQYNVKH